MILKVIRRKAARRGNFRPLTTYVLQDFKAGWVALSPGLTVASAAFQMNAIASLNPRVENPVLHVAISWAPTDVVNEQLMAATVRGMIDALNLQGCQWVAVAHNDAMHRHVHVIVNRVHPQTLRAVDMSFNYHRLRRLAVELEARFGWKPTLPPPGNAQVAINGRTWKMTDMLPAPPAPGARQSHLFIGRESFQEWLADEPREAVFEVLNSQRPSWESVHAALAEFSLVYEPYGKGAIIRDAVSDRFRGRAGHLARFATLPKMEARLGPYRAALPGLPASFAKSYLASVDNGRDAWGPPELVDGYRAYRSDFKDARARRWARQRTFEASRRQFVLESERERLAELRARKDLKPRVRKALRQAIKADAQISRSNLRDVAHDEREKLRVEIKETLKPLTQRGWVMAQAKAGNAIAEDYLVAVRWKQRLRSMPPEPVASHLGDLTVRAPRAGVRIPEPTRTIAMPAPATAPKSPRLRKPALPAAPTLPMEPEAPRLRGPRLLEPPF